MFVHMIKRIRKQICIFWDRHSIFIFQDISIGILVFYTIELIRKSNVHFLMRQAFLFDFVTKKDESLSDLPVFSVSLKVFCCAVMSNNLYSHLKSETGWQQYTCEWGIHNLAFLSIPRNRKIKKYNMRDKGILM